MHLTRALPLLAALILALVSAGCDSGGGGGPAADAMNGVDTAGPDTVNPDVVAEDTTAADVPGEDSPAAEIVDPPPCEGPGVAGQVIQAEGGPISGAKLFLCGTVNGAETCSPRTADDQGFFSFQTLDPGYTHLEVNATLAGFRMEKLFVGYSLAVDPSGPDCLDMGEIVLQELPEGGENVVTADGGAVQIGALTLEFPPGCPVFPDFSGEAAVGGAEPKRNKRAALLAY